MVVCERISSNARRLRLRKLGVVVVVMMMSMAMTMAMAMVVPMRGQTTQVDMRALRDRTRLVHHGPALTMRACHSLGKLHQYQRNAQCETHHQVCGC